VADFRTARIIELGSDGGRSHLVSEHVNGPSLQEFTEAEAPPAGGALAAIHRAGVLHRDFTPYNVLTGPDGPRVIDFGTERSRPGHARRRLGQADHRRPDARERTHAGRQGRHVDRRR
jgi:serine/threonine protein kinase